MQSSFYVPDEIEARHGMREPCTLDDHHEFAKEVLGEKEPILPKAIRESNSIWHGLLEHTAEFPAIYIVWGLELFWLLFIVMATSMEMWGSCPFEMGLAPVCQYCYSTVFLVWDVVLVVAWFFNLYLFVLLTSRGFQARFMALGRVTSENRPLGIPVNAMHLFSWLCFLLVVWLIVGVIILVKSNECVTGPKIYANRYRSTLMTTTTLLSAIFVPVLLLLGRCSDVNKALMRCL